MEQLKADVACWKGHCMDAETQAKELRYYFKQCVLGQLKLDPGASPKACSASHALCKRKESAGSESQELL